MTASATKHVAATCSNEPHLQASLSTPTPLHTCTRTRREGRLKPQLAQYMHHYVHGQFRPSFSPLRSKTHIVLFSPTHTPSLFSPPEPFVEEPPPESLDQRLRFSFSSPVSHSSSTSIHHPPPSFAIPNNLNSVLSLTSFSPHFILASLRNRWLISTPTDQLIHCRSPSSVRGFVLHPRATLMTPFP